MVTPHRYDPIGRCIYCGNPPFGEEHIIPRNIGGTLLLPEASCRTCEKTIGLYEDTCAKRFFGVAKAHLGIKGRKSRRAARHIVTDVSGVPIKIPLHDHPGYLVFFVFFPPRALLGFPPSPSDHELSGHVILSRMHADAEERRKRLNKDFTIGRNLHTIDLARQLGKIAYSFAVAEFTRRRLGVFTPYVLPLILGDLDCNAGRLVGGVVDEIPRPGMLTTLRKPSNAMHSLLLRTETVGPINLLVAEIRLFSQYDTPTYQVVVGECEKPLLEPLLA